MNGFNHISLRKFLSIIVVSLLGIWNILASNIVYAVTGTFSTTETTPNSPVITEEKASRTITTNTLPANDETITIGLCVVSFINAPDDTDDLNCIDNAASISRSTSSGGAGTPRTAAQIASLLRSLLNVYDTNHGALNVSSIGTNATFTTAGSETSATTINFTDNTFSDISSTSSTPGVLPFSGVAQIVNFTPSASDPKDQYHVTINGNNLMFQASVSGSSIQTIVEALTPNMNSLPEVSCTEDNTKIICSADTAGTAFTYSASVAAGNFVAPVISEVTSIVTPSGDATPNYTFTTNEPGNITYGGACSSTTANAATGSNTITFNVLSEGTYTNCTIRVTDSFGNQSMPLSVSSFTIETSTPSVSLSTNAPSPTNGAFTVTATFSRGVTGITLSDFIVANGIASAFNTISSTIYTVLITPTADGNVTVSIPTNAGMDLSGNNTTAAYPLSRTFDGTIPTIVISSFPAINVSNSGAILISGSCSENGRVVSISVGEMAKTATCTSLVWSNTFNLATNTATTAIANHTDLAGNAALTASRTTTRDTSISGTSNNTTVLASVTPPPTPGIKPSLAPATTTGVIAPPKPTLQTQTGSSIIIKFGSGSKTIIGTFDASITEFIASRISPTHGFMLRIGTKSKKPIILSKLATITVRTSIPNNSVVTLNVFDSGKINKIGLAKVKDGKIVFKTRIVGTYLITLKRKLK